MKKEHGQFSMQITEKEALERLEKRLQEQKLKSAEFSIGNLKVKLSL